MERQSTKEELKQALLVALTRSLDEASNDQAAGHTVEETTEGFVSGFSNRMDLLVDAAWSGDPTGAVASFGQSGFRA